MELAYHRDFQFIGPLDFELLQVHAPREGQGPLRDAGTTSEAVRQRKLLLQLRVVSLLLPSVSFPIRRVEGVRVVRIGEDRQD